MTTHYTPLGYDPIDQDHTEFLQLLSRLKQCEDNEFPLLFEHMLDHCERHFDRENQLMQQFAFPAESEHSSEHRRVLNELRGFKSRVDQGRLDFCRTFLQTEFPQWFQLHASTMDSAVVFHINIMLDGNRSD